MNSRAERKKIKAERKQTEQRLKEHGLLLEEGSGIGREVGIIGGTVVGVAGLIVGGIFLAGGFNSSSAPAAPSAPAVPHGITVSKPVSTLGGYVDVYTVRGKDFTCNIADNTNWQEGPGVSCTRTAGSLPTSAIITTGGNGDVQLAFNQKTGCFVADSTNWSDNSVAISCPTPTAAAAAPKSSAPKS
jgi:hypothetical protein